MARSNILGLLEALDSDYITVHQTRCVQVRNKNATCMRCAEACTSGCISYRENELIISPERCIGCGTCATVCPTCALEAHHPNDAKLYAQCRAVRDAADGQVVIACEQLARAANGLYDPDKVAVATCLGRVEESLAVRLAAEGASRIVLVKGACETCGHAVGITTAHAVCDTANALLEAWNGNTRVRIADKLPSSTRLRGDAGYDKGKRALFSQAAGNAKEAAASSVDYAVRDALDAQPSAEERENAAPLQYLKVMADGTLPHFVPDRRERLLDALAQMGDPEPAMISTRLWGHVSIDMSRCVSCRMCATFCPTGAIVKFDEADGKMGIEHRSGDCVKCRCCADICPEGALTVDDEVSTTAITEGLAERHIMPPRTKVPSGPHAILDYMKDLISDTDQIYER